MHNDKKNIFFAHKLIHILLKNNPEKFKVIVKHGIPEKMIENFNENWHIAITEK